MKDRVLSEQILKVVQTHPEHAYNYKQIAAVLAIKDPFIRKRIVTLLSQLAKNGVLVELSRGKFQIKSSNIEHEGHIQTVSKGGGYFISPKIEKDIYIHPSNLKNALNGDKVLVRSTLFKGKEEGRIVKIIERVKKEYIGVIEISPNFSFFVPDDRSVKTHFFIEKKHLNGAKNGQKVKVKFLSWPKNAKSPQAAVIEIIGNPGELNVEMNSILSEFGFPTKFLSPIIKDLEKIEIPNYDKEAKKRRDFRNITTFTIDPVDAKDFDDALSFKKIDEKIIEVGVHIADVGHFVKEKSIIDNEAFQRGNSVYLVDRVIPMLPEKLSNVLCSLRPKEDKLTFSVVFKMSLNGEILDTWFGKTVIHSNHRFNYEDVQEIIEGQKHSLSNELITLNNIAKTIRSKRLNNGALNIESSEVRFQLNEKGFPIGTFIKISKEAHQLIEEFMLLANKYVAMKMGKPHKNKLITPFIFRVHDDPNEEKLNDLKIYLQSMGYELIRKKNKPISFSLNEVMKKAKEKKELHLISPMVIRSMSKAVYSSDNIGHYGLSFQYYTHFTSPIRRYADLIVHRKLFETLSEKSGYSKEQLEHTCNHISKMEKQAVDAERASIKYMQVLYLGEKIGEQFNGMINGLTDWGMYVELDKNKCEGMIPLNSIKDDQYYYDDEQKLVIGHNSRKSFKIGQEIKVIVKKADLHKRQIDFKLIN
ncbi:MAG: ribonuclease R [Bacteroidetes bacterium MED-G20]|nr:MAG: ribonuclease R [Bacteroidetes bacterium MED-G20]